MSSMRMAITVHFGKIYFKHRYSNVSYSSAERLRSFYFLSIFSFLGPIGPEAAQSSDSQPIFRGRNP
jgi:hypothetical protein